MARNQGEIVGGARGDAGNGCEEDDVGGTHASARGCGELGCGLLDRARVAGFLRVGLDSAQLGPFPLFFVLFPFPFLFSVLNFVK